MEIPSHRIRNEVDRFGFSTLLALRRTVSHVPQLGSCFWLHGWKWYDLNDIRLIGMRDLRRRSSLVVVATPEQRISLNEAGLENVLVGGLPFSYVLDIPLEHSFQTFGDRDTIVVLPKSQDGERMRPSSLSLIEKVLSDSDTRSRSVFCVYKGDYESGLNEQKFKGIDIPFIVGASPTYPLDLLRTKKIFAGFKRLITNTIGSHIVYAGALGLEVVITTPYDVRPRSLVASRVAHLNPDDQLIDYLEKVYSVEFFCNRFSHVFSADVPCGKIVDWSLDQLGFKYRLNDEQIAYCLGHGLKGNFRVLRERISVVFKRSDSLSNSSHIK